MIGTAGECSNTRAKVSRPRLSGSERSSSTSPAGRLARESSPLYSRSAQCSSNSPFAPVLPRKVEVEQEDVGPRRVRVLALAAQELDRLDAVLGPVQVVEDLAFLERLLGQAHVGRVVLDQQDLDRRAGLSFSHGDCLSSSVA